MGQKECPQGRKELARRLIAESLGETLEAPNATPDFVEKVGRLSALGKYTVAQGLINSNVSNLYRARQEAAIERAKFSDAADQNKQISRRLVAVPDLDPAESEKFDQWQNKKLSPTQKRRLAVYLLGGKKPKIAGLKELDSIGGDYFRQKYAGQLIFEAARERQNG